MARTHSASLWRSESLLRCEVLPTLLPPIGYMTSFALLPAEIVRLVLECAARDSSQTAARLLRVSKLVHGWIQPLFYDILIISLSTYRKRVLEKLPALYASWVRHICITFPADIHPSPHLPALFYPSYLHVLQRTADLGGDIHRILDAAGHLSHLYIDITLPAAFNSPALTHLHCGSWEAWLCAGRHIASLASLTHLRIDVAYNAGNASSFACLLALTRLSHLAIALDSRNDPHELRSAAKFARAMGTRVPLVVVSAWYCWASTSEGVRDAFRGMPENVCVLGMEGSPDRDMSVKEWEEEARGGKSIWSRANDVLRSQKENVAMGI